MFIMMQNFLNDPLFKVRNKYLFSNYIKDQNIINRHPDNKISFK